MSRLADSGIAGNLDKVAELANHLMQTKPAFVQAVAAMLVSRKLYAASTYEIDTLVEKLDFAKDGPPKNDDTPVDWSDEHKVFLKEILISASVAKACDSFDSADLLRELVKSVIPWLTRVSAEHTQAQLDQRKRAEDEAERIRLNTPIDVGFAIQNKLTVDEPSRLNRDLSVLLIGERAVIQWFMRFIEKKLAEFGSGASKVLQLAGGALASTVVADLRAPVDVVLVHNIGSAYPKSVFMPLLVCVNEAQRRLKRLCADAGSLLISALPLERKLKANELHAADYEILRVHNLLRAVTAEPVVVNDRPHLRVIVGVEEVAVIPAEEIVSLGRVEGV